VAWSMYKNSSVTASAAAPSAAPVSPTAPASPSVSGPFARHRRVAGIVTDEWGNVYDDGDPDDDTDPTTDYDPTMDPNNYDAFGNYIGPDVGTSGSFGEIDDFGSVSTYGSSATYGSAAYGGAAPYATPLQDPANYDASGNYVPVDPTENPANYDANGNYLPPSPLQDPLNYNAQGDYIGPPNNPDGSPLDDYDGSPVPSPMMAASYVPPPPPPAPVFDPSTMAAPASYDPDQGAFGPLPVYGPGGPPSGPVGPDNFAYSGGALGIYADAAPIGSFDPSNPPTFVDQAAPGETTVDMQWRANQWIVVTRETQDLRHLLPPPPNQSANAGAWHRYPGGIAHGPWGKNFGHTQVNPGGARPMVTVRAWNVPSDTTVYAWRPNTGTLCFMNGHWYYGTGDWYVGNDGHGEHIYTLSKADLPPAPPGAKGLKKINGVVYDNQSARWVLDHPGLLTWRSENDNENANLFQAAKNAARG
jgi:hypothetical protein